MLVENGDATACPCDGRGTKTELNDRPTSDGRGGKRRDVDGHETTRDGVAESVRGQVESRMEIQEPKTQPKSKWRVEDPTGRLADGGGSG